MWENKNLPAFGPLKGVKVVHTAQALAGPFAAQLLADYGADVIWVENGLHPDLSRYSYDYGMEFHRRNQRNIALNIPTPEGKEIFRKLMEGADVYVESYKAGQLDKWGFTDEELWKINPRLIIAHHSGFGQTGDPNYVSKPSFDPIAQAFGGHMDGNRGPDTAPHTIGPFAGDYASGLILTVGILAALYNVSKTGVGESVDVAQYECMMRINSPSVDFLTAGTPIRPTGYPNRMAGQSTYKCKDGAYIQTCFAGYANIKKVIPFLNLEYGGEDFPEGIGLVATDTEGGKKLEAALTAYAATKTASEAESEFLAMGLPATKVNSVADLDNLPHVKARKTIAEYENLKGVKIRAVGVVPTFKKSPGRVWRSCPYQGMDNEEILKDLGYSKEEIDGFYGKQILGRDAEMKYLYPYKKPGE